MIQNGLTPHFLAISILYFNLYIPIHHRTAPIMSLPAGPEYYYILYIFYSIINIIIIITPVVVHSSGFALLRITLGKKKTKAPGKCMLSFSRFYDLIKFESSKILEYLVLPVCFKSISMNPSLPWYF